MGNRFYTEKNSGPHNHIQLPWGERPSFTDNENLCLDTTKTCLTALWRGCFWITILLYFPSGPVLGRGRSGLEILPLPCPHFYHNHLFCFCSDLGRQVQNWRNALLPRAALDYRGLSPVWLSLLPSSHTSGYASTRVLRGAETREEDLGLKVSLALSV